MEKSTIQLIEADYKHLKKAAGRYGMSVPDLIHEWVTNLPQSPEIKESFDVSKDPVFRMEGYDSDAPGDLSINLDKYLYKED
jgi:hypothetical protein